VLQGPERAAARHVLQREELLEHPRSAGNGQPWAQRDAHAGGAARRGGPPRAAPLVNVVRELNQSESRGNTRVHRVRFNLQTPDPTEQVNTQRRERAEAGPEGEAPRSSRSARAHGSPVIAIGANIGRTPKPQSAFRFGHLSSRVGRRVGRVGRAVALPRSRESLSRRAPRRACGCACRQPATWATAFRFPGATRVWNLE
jgi:hypothetical protein